MTYEVTIFASKWNGSFCSNISGDSFEAAVANYAQHTRWDEEDIVSARRTHTNVVELRHVDGSVSYHVVALNGSMYER